MRIYLKTALSGWVSKVVLMAAKFAMIPVLIRYLPTHQYAALVILGSLEGWFFLLDLGLGSSLQNYLSEYKAHNKPEGALLKTACVLGLFGGGAGLLILWLILPLLSQFFLGSVLSFHEGQSIFFMGGLFLFLGTFGSLAFKVLMARGKGHMVYIAQAGMSLLSFIVLLFFILHGEVTLKKSLIALLGVPGVGSFLLAAVIFSKASWKEKICWDVLRRARGFFVFSCLAACVTLSDALIVPKVLHVEGVIEYNLLCKVFGVASFAYGALVQGFWPECSESMASGMLSDVRRKLKMLSTWSVIGIALFTLIVWSFSGILKKVFTFEFGAVPILFFGFYLSIRVVSDFYAMALQSASHLTVFFYLVPLQAVLSFSLQCFLAGHFGVVGILSGLSLSYLLTVFWVLPRSFQQLEDYHNSKTQSA